MIRDERRKKGKKRFSLCFRSHKRKKEDEFWMDDGRFLLWCLERGEERGLLAMPPPLPLARFLSLLVAVLGLRPSSRENKTDSKHVNRGLT